MKRLATLSYGSVFVLSVSCATSPPPAPRIPFDLPHDWSGEIADRPLGPTSDTWWHQFDDPALDGLIAEALERSPTLGAAAARLEAAAARARIAGADRKLTIQGGLSSRRGRQNFIGLPIPGTEGEVLTNTSTTQGLNLDIAWEVDLWGRLSAGGQAALARAEAAEADLAAVRLSLIGQVAKSWFARAEALAQVALGEVTLANRTRARAQTEGRYRRGLLTAVDLRLALTNEANAQEQLIARRQDADRANRRLEILLARYPGGGSITDDVGLPQPPTAVALGQPAELVTRRPDLIAAELRLAASGLDVQAARAALYPQLRLTGSLGRSSVDIEDLIDSDFSVWSLAAGLLQPIFQGGRLRAAVDASEATRIEAAESYINAALTAFSDVESALATEAFIAARLDRLNTATSQSGSARDLAEERYRSGLTGYLTVLEAERQWTLNQRLLLLLRRQQLEARVDLHLALGGGYATDPAPADDTPKETS